jgi:hypothetical protein
MGSLSPDRQGENLEILFFHPKNLFADGKNASDHSHSKRLKLQAVVTPRFFAGFGQVMKMRSGPSPSAMPVWTWSGMVMKLAA